MLWAVRYVRASRETVSCPAVDRSVGIAIAITGCFALASCSTTYERGLDAASDIVSELGVDKTEDDRLATRDTGLGSGFQNTSFGRTIREAVLAFPALAGQQAQIRSVAARMDGLIGSLRPQLSTGLSTGQDLLAGGSDGPATDARITMRQLVFDGAATRNRIALTSINQRQVSLELDVLLSSLSRQMALAGLELWRQTELLRLAEEDVAAHEAFVEQTEERAAGGVIAESDRLSAQSRLADARASLARSRSSLSAAEASYLALVGDLPREVVKPPPPPSMEASVARERVGTSSQMIAARLLVAEARSQRDVVLSGRYPGVFLQVTGTREDLFANDAENDIFAGLSVDYALTSGGQQRAREREAESQLSAARSRLEEAERQIGRALDVALANREALAFEIEAAADAVRLNEASLAAVRDQFGIGSRSIVNILDAQRDLTSARAREVVVEANSIQAEFEILELTGDLAAVFGIEYDPFAETRSPVARGGLLISGRASEESTSVGPEESGGR